MPVYRHTERLLKPRYTAAGDRTNHSIRLLLEAIIEARPGVASELTIDVRADEPGGEAGRSSADWDKARVECITAVHRPGPAPGELMVQRPAKLVAGGAEKYARTTGEPRTNASENPLRRR